MPTRSAISGLITAILCAGSATAQAQSSTLSTLLQDADAVVRLQVLATDHSQVGSVGVMFRLQEQLTGLECPPRIELREPAGRSCGRALHGLLPRASYLAFLDRGTGDTWQLTVSGSRSLVLRDPLVDRHLQELLATREDPARRVEVLSEALSSDQDRVRIDAAWTLSTSGDLERLDPIGRIRVETALERSLSGADLDLLPLLISSSRLRSERSLGAMVDHYLSAEGTPYDRAVLRSIGRFDPARVRARIQTRDLPSGAAELRAVQLAEVLPPAEAQPLLLQLLGSADTETRTRSATALMRRGLDRREVMRRTDDDTAIRAELRLQNERRDRPRFRALFGGQR